MPVLILFEGSSGRVIGRVCNELIRCLEPRGVSYKHFDPSDQDGPRTMLDFLQHTPGKGQIGLYDRSWYSSMIKKCNVKEKEKELDRMLDICNDFERYLTDNGVLLIKIVLRAEPSGEYVQEYGSGGPKRSFLSADYIDPLEYRDVMFDRVYVRTDTEYAPWNSISARGVGETVLKTAHTIIKAVEDGLERKPAAAPLSDIERIYSNPRHGTESCCVCTPYEDAINELSEKLGELQMDLSLSDRSLAVCFEGWDAAGKGSCIKHLCHALNPRGYEVFQTKAPSDEEMKHTYLWRFCGSAPRKGHITVYDRTWYGRMMVEHVEGLCTDEEYGRSSSEINSFEHLMADSGTIILKFWLDITREEQLKRFEKRKNDPLKQWKITDDDWRNRSKWDEYDVHVDTMMESTNTQYARWTVIESGNKKCARVKVLQTVVETLEKELND
jgi:polyphosphate kinase 2 (PPK2 family)